MADDQTGIPNELYVQHYQSLAEGGTGLIITGHMYVHRAGKCHPEMTAIDHPQGFNQFKTVIDIVHQHQARIIPQINFGGLQCSKEVNKINLAPSFYEDHGDSTAPNRTMTEEEILEVKEAFISAAKRVKEAGFDGVMLHGAHGYFINQMLSPHINHRQDQWGGSFDNRLRFLRETAAGVRTVVGTDFPMLIKLGLSDGQQVNGLQLEDGLKIAAMLESMGFDGLEISGGYGSNSIGVVRSPEQEGYFREWAKQVRQVTNLPLMLVGGFRSLSIMQDLIQSGDADVISLCRPLICEPDLINSFQQHEKTKADCISCGRCFAREMNQGTLCRWKYGKSA